MKEKGRIDKLRPTESDFKGKPGYERYHVVQETVGDVVVRRRKSRAKRRTVATSGAIASSRTNTASPLGRPGLWPKLKPWMRADSERQLGLQAQMPRTAR